MDKKIELFQQLLEVKRYSINSINTYVGAFRQFLTYFKGHDVDDLTERQIEQYINLQVTERKISISYQKQLVAAIKFWYIGVLGRKMQLDYLYPDRAEFKIPISFRSRQLVYGFRVPTFLLRRYVVIVALSGNTVYSLLHDLNSSIHL